MSEKVLLLCMDKTNYIFPYMEYENITLEESYIPTKNKLQYYAVKLFKKVPYLSYFCYGCWKRHVSEFDKIIILDEGYDPPMQTFFHRYKVPVFLFVWNSIVNSQRKLKRSIAKTKSFEIYTFDKQDSEKYHLKYNSTMYPKKIIDMYAGSQGGDEKYALFFVGLDKGRSQKLQEIKACLDKWDMPCYFRIMNGSKRMEYSEYLSILNETGAILDVVEDGQTGLTLRVMESLFFGKKLVTTNKSVRNYEFYRPCNVFIWGEDPIDELPGFLSGAYEPLPQDVVDQYEVEQWIQRFI